MKTLEELTQSIASCQDKLKQSLADMGAEDKNKDMMNQMYSMCSEIYNYASYIHNSLSKHCSVASHIPPIKSAGQMQKAIKALGMEEDYQVEPRTIYASINGIIEVDLSKTKTH